LWSSFFPQPMTGPFSRVSELPLIGSPVAVELEGQTRALTPLRDPRDGRARRPMKVVEAHAETVDRCPTGDAVHAGAAATDLDSRQVWRNARAGDEEADTRFGRSLDDGATAVIERTPWHPVRNGRPTHRAATYRGAGRGCRGVALALGSLTSLPLEARNSSSPNCSRLCPESRRNCPDSPPADGCRRGVTWGEQAGEARSSAPFRSATSGFRCVGSRSRAPRGEGGHERRSRASCT
jgi:hypothetical protein